MGHSRCYRACLIFGDLAICCNRIPRLSGFLFFLYGFETDVVFPEKLPQNSLAFCWKLAHTWKLMVDYSKDGHASRLELLLITLTEIIIVLAYEEPPNSDF